MPNGEELYKALKQDPKYSGIGNSYESFVKYFSNPENGQKLYQTLSADKKYSGIGKDYNSFSSYFFGSQKSPSQLNGGQNFDLGQYYQKPDDNKTYQKVQQNPLGYNGAGSTYVAPSVPKSEADKISQQTFYKIQKPVSPPVEKVKQNPLGFGDKDNTTAVQPQETEKGLEAKFTAQNIADKEKQNLPEGLANTVDIYFKQAGKKPTDEEWQAKWDELTNKYNNKSIYLDYTPSGKPIMVSDAGFFHSIIPAFKQAVNADNEASDVVNMSPQEQIDFFNKKAQQEDEYLPERPKSLASDLGATIGGGTPVIAKGITGAIIGSALAANPEISVPLEAAGLSAEGLPAFMSFLAMAHSSGNSGYANSLYEYYLKGKQERLSDDEALTKARGQAYVGEAKELAMAALLSKTPSFAKADAGVKKSLGKYLEESASTIGKTALYQGVIAGGTEGAAQAAASTQYDITPKEAFDKTWDAASNMVKAYAVFHFVNKGIEKSVELPGYAMAQMKGYLSTLPKEVLADMQNKAIQSGSLTPEQAADFDKGLSAFEAAKSQVPSSFPEEKLNALAGLIEKRTNLENKQKEAVANAAPEFKEEAEKQYADEIKSTTAQILKIKFAKEPLSEEKNYLSNGVSVTYPEENKQSDLPTVTIGGANEETQTEIPNRETISGSNTSNEPITSKESSDAKEVIGETSQPTNESEKSGGLSRGDVGPQLKPKEGYVYRAVDNANDATGTDKSFSNKTNWYEGEGFLIEAKNADGKNIEHHEGAKRGSIKDEDVTTVYYEPNGIATDNKTVEQELAKMKDKFPNAKFVEVESIEDKNGENQLHIKDQSLSSNTLKEGGGLSRGDDGIEDIPEIDAVPIADVKNVPNYTPEKLAIGENIYYSFNGKDFHKGEVVNQPSAAKPNVYTVKNENGVPTVIIYGGERTNVKLKSDPSLSSNTPSKTVVSENPALKDVESTAKALGSVDKNKKNKLLGDKVVYHGTNTDFDVLDEKKQNAVTGHGDFGKGFYFTLHEGNARYYTLKFDKTVRRVKSFIYDISTPFEINIKDEVFDERTKKQLSELKNVSQSEKEIISNSLNDDFGYKKITKGIGDERFSEILKSNGFDSVWVNRTLGTENQMGAEIVIFDRNKVKEITDKSISEAYHKAKADSSNPELVKAVEDLLSNNTPSKEQSPNIEPKPPSTVKTKVEGEGSGVGDVTSKAIEAKPTVISNKKESFKIATPDKSTKDVIGQSVSLSGYEGLDLFVHREDGKNGDFVLTEKRTGLEIGRGKTAKEAADKAIATLKWQQAYNKEYPSIYNQVNGHIDKNGTIDGSGKYENISIPEISNTEKIKILEDKIKEQEQEITDEIKKASKYLSAANTEFQQKFIDRIKERISEIKNDKQSLSPNIPKEGGGGLSRGDVELHKQNIHDKFRKEFEAKGVPKEQVDGAIALMEARAKSWASEENGRNPDEWYGRIADVKSGEFEAKEESPISEIVNEVKDELPKIENKAVAKEETEVGNEPQPKVSTVTETDTKKQPVNKIEDLQDVGEKIGGAKKDLAQKLSKVTTEDLATKPLSKVFPKPDFKKLFEEGSLSEDGAIFLNFLYKNIPAKPRKQYRVANWVRSVDGALQTTRQILEAESIKNLDLTDKIVKAVTLSETLKRDYKLYSETMKGLGFPKNDVNLGGYEIKKFENRSKFNKETGKLEPVKGEVYSIVNGSSIVGDFKTMDDAINGLKTLLNRSEEKTKGTKFDIYQDRNTKEYFIGKKGAIDVVRVMQGFKTLSEAKTFLKEKQADIQGLWDAMKAPKERRMANRPRVGTDWRKGKNVDSKEFADTFGFRGVEFGNWVNNEERQSHVNEAYDALMDLSSVLGVSPKALSLNGELGFAFGARGGGKANAHYEPGKVVINLTKTRGAGSLAHEWWHAMDNYFSRNRGQKESFITQNPRDRIERDGSRNQGVRKEMIDAFKSVMDAIQGTKLTERSKVLDRARSDAYWSTNIEMSARAFENYVIEKLGERNQQNDYLANFKETAEWINDTKGDINALKNYPYPLAEESPIVNEKFQQFFETIKEDEKSKLFQDNKGAVETLADGRKVIHALDAPDFSTMVHEIAHVFEGDLTESESKIVKDFGGSEAFARGFERYLRDGKAPTTELKTLFEKFKQWLTNIYKTLKGSPIEKRITPEIKQIFDRLLTEQKDQSLSPNIPKEVVGTKVEEGSGGVRGDVELYHAGNIERISDNSLINELGIHLGSKETADKISEAKGVDTKQYKVEIKNPIEVPDFPRWEAFVVSRKLKDMGILTENEFEKIRKKTGNDKEKLLLKLLKAKGYDGFVYDNAFEGGGKSYVAFDKKQVKPVEQSLKEQPKAETPTPKTTTDQTQDSKGVDGIGASKADKPPLKASDRIRQKAQQIRDKGFNDAFNLPKADIGDAKKQSFGGKALDDAIAKAFDIVADAIDAGEHILDAIEKGYKSLHDYYKANTKSFDENKLRKEFEGYFEDEIRNAPPKPPVQETNNDKGDGGDSISKFSKERFSDLSKKERERGAYEHLIDSKVEKNVIDKFKKSGIKYKVADSGEAQNFGKNIIESFGVDESLRLARLNTFHPSVNSAVFAEAIDHYRTQEKNAATQVDKYEAAKKWADTFDEYAELLTSAGQFSSYSYNFYKTSKLGFLLSAEKKFKGRQDWFINRDKKSINEAFDALMEVPEFSNLFVEKVEEAKSASKQTLRAEQKKKISDAWDSIKLSKSNTYAVPVPPSIINGAIEVMKRGHLLAYDVAKLVQDGIDYINKHHKEGWDEDKFRKDFTAQAEGIYRASEVSSNQRLDAYKENLRKQIKDIDDQITAKQRKAKNAKAFELDEEAQQLIQQRNEKRKELNAAVPLEKTAQKILDKWEKKLDKLTPEKRKALASKVVGEIVKNGGLDRQTFNDLYAEALGLPSLTPEMKTNLLDLGGKLNAVDEAKEALDKDPTQANIDNYVKAMKEGEEASRKINHLLGEKGISLDRFLSIAKLNTLGVANLLMNPLYNVGYSPFRFGESIVHTGLDYGLKYIGFPKKNGIYENVLYKQGGYYKGFAEGLKKSIQGIIKGETTYDLHQKSVRQNIRPIGAVKEIIAHHKGESPLTNSEYANAVMEAFPTMGASAAFISRALQVGDLPFRFAAERATLESIAKQKGLIGVKKDAFILNPDETSVALMKKAGDDAVQSQSNIITDAINRVSTALKPYTTTSVEGKALSAVAKVVGATTQPFIKIPLNNAITVMQLVVPEMAVTEGVYQAIKGNRDASLRAFSRAVVGYSMGAALSQLAALGLVSATSDDKDKINTAIAKEDISGDQRLNLTGLRRWINGGTPQEQEGDLKISLNLLGITGTMLNVYGQKFDKLPQSEWDKLGYIDNLTSRLNGSFTGGIKNNVFGNTSTLISAMGEGNAYTTNKWLRGSLGVLENSFDPSWLSTASKISDGYKPDYTAMNLTEQLSAQLKERVFKGGELPSQITMWGEKRTDAPKDRNPFLYYYLDISKARNVDTSDFGYNLLGLYNRTKEDAIFPSRPQKTVRSNNNSYQLSPKEYEEYQILVGKQRKELVGIAMNTPEYNNASDDEKVKILKNLYSKGAEIGKAQLYNAHLEDFKKAGLIKNKTSDNNQTVKPL